MRKEFIIIGFTIGILCVSSLVFSADVIVLKHSKKYHLATCTLVAGQQRFIMDEKQAIAKGLKACEQCIIKRSTVTPAPAVSGAGSPQK